MIKLTNTFAIGCLVQWYEIELIPLYIESVNQSLEHIENKENVIVDFKLVVNQDLEKIDESQITMDEIITRFEKMIDGFELDVTDKLVRVPVAPCYIFNLDGASTLAAESCKWIIVQEEGDNSPLDAKYDIDGIGADPS